MVKLTDSRIKRMIKQKEKGGMNNHKIAIHEVTRFFYVSIGPRNARERATRP